MLRFLLNAEDVATDMPPGMTVLDFVRYHRNLKGTKIGCREGDCGACTILVGELRDRGVTYRTMTSCLMPLANAAGKHIVTIEGINREDGSLTPVQQAMVDENGTQCGFCTVGFVMSLTGFCIDETAKTPEMAVSSIDGNICRCTGYKSIERAAGKICEQLQIDSPPYQGGVAEGRGGSPLGQGSTADDVHSLGVGEPPRQQKSLTPLLGKEGSLRAAIDKVIVPVYFSDIAERLSRVQSDGGPLEGGTPNVLVGGGTDVYVQRPEAMVETQASHVFYDERLRGIRDLGDRIEIGASATVTDLLESPVMNAAFPDLYKHLKLVSSTPIRNMATLAGNFVNASPIGDMTIWFLALNSEIVLSSGREMLLKQLYLGYKQLAKEPDEYITAIRFKKPTADHYFNFEKVCKRTYLDIATVNTAILLRCESLPGQAWTPPALSAAGGDFSPQRRSDAEGPANVEYNILDAHVSAGGVAPIPLFLKETSSFLVGRTVNEETIDKANEIMQLEISPISDVRGTEEYKRLLLRQLFRAHFVGLFGSI